MENGLPVASDKSLNSSLACCQKKNSSPRSMQQTQRFFNVVNVFYIDRIRNEEFAVPPFFKEHLQNVLQEEGNVVKFQCKVGGCPVPNVAWFKGHEKIQEFCEDNALHEFIGYKYYASKANGNLTLVITNVLPGDLGPYTCKIWNQVGEARSTAMLYSHSSRNNNKESKKEKDTRKKPKKIVLEETITIIERRRAPTTTTFAVERFGNNKSVAGNCSDESADKAAKDAERLTLTFSIPTNCETRNLAITTSTTHNENQTKDDAQVNSSTTTDNKMSQISPRIEESIQVTKMQTEDTTPHPRTTEDESQKSDSYSNTENLSSPESDFTDSETRERVNWIRQGESSESDFRRDSLPYPFPTVLNEKAAESHQWDSKELVGARERRSQWKNNMSRTLENDYVTSNFENTNGLTRKSSVLLELSSASALFSSSGRTYSSGSIGSSVGTGAIARFVRAKSLNEYFEQFFDRSSRDISQQNSDEDFNEIKTPPSAEDRSEYTDVFEDDMRGDVSVEYSDNEDGTPSKFSSTNVNNDLESYSDLSSMVSDTTVHKTSQVSEENSPGHDVPKSPIVREMALLNKNIFDVQAAKELDELVAKLIEFSQESYVSVSSLKIGGWNQEPVTLHDYDDTPRIIQPASSLQHLAFSASQLQQTVPSSDKKESRHHKPEFIIPLEDIVVDAVEDVILNISVTGVPAPRIRWFRDGQPLDEDEEGIINDNLKRQSAVYTCVATNEVGEAISTARLTALSSSPMIKRFPLV